MKKSKITYIEENEFEYPKILYKYRHLNDKFYENILLDNTLYFSSPRDFEDDNDCRLKEKFPPKKKLFQFFLSISKKENICYSRKQHRNWASFWSKKSPLASISKLTSFSEKYADLFCDIFGVCSLTYDCENTDMWRKYSDNFTGICIGFDTEKILSIAGGGGLVLYSEKLPTMDFIKDDNQEKYIKNIYSKADKWSFEKEYRLHKIWKQPPISKERNIKLPENSIVEIILGNKISEKNKNKLLELININLKNIIIKEF
ncbi:MAG: DUF2971 domain-containing protein [Marinifilaceae bacterium]|jgi:hypothetical protein|nr:DUF2971 domain-containing protein [Marinifilaceae bacterium]